MDVHVYIGINGPPCVEACYGGLTLDRPIRSGVRLVLPYDISQPHTAGDARSRTVSWFLGPDNGIVSIAYPGT